MSFRLRIVLVITVLFTILFGVGGAVLIHSSFQASLRKEEETAVESNELVLRIVQYVEEGTDWFEEKELISVIKNICTQDSIDCLRLISGEEAVYLYQKKENLDVYLHEITEIEENQVVVTYFTMESGEQYLQTTIQFRLHDKDYYLDMGRNLTTVYSVREEQIDVFQKTFLVLSLLGVFFACLQATVLTRPLRKLQKASKEIEMGNLSFRSNIKSGDEVGELSAAFDKMAKELENTITLLKESAEQKEMFMGAFTHELKTPMTSIIGYSDLLRSQNLSEKDRADALNYIFSEAKRLENMSLKMLDLFVADKKKITLKACSPADLTSYVVKHLQNIYAKSNVTIEVNAQKGQCLLEPDLFQTLLINLLDNARKSMEQGGMIVVTVSVTAKGCILSVVDEGGGIPEASLRHLTEAFYRVDKARARVKGSAGLGLALCDKIVQLHHGTMEFESAEGVGTKVTVTLNGGVYEE